MEINHFSHRHPLVLVDQETGTDQSPKHYCSGCEEAVERSTYSCGKCRFFLHKKCAELPGVINHPLHLQHPLVLSGTPYAFSKGFICNLCLGTREGFAYHCSSCQFDLDISCATHPQLVAGDFQKLQHFSHKHPLVFVQNIDFGNKNKVCFGCERGMSSPFYSCPDCPFYLHKKCAELPGVINHPLHLQHPLVLSGTPYAFSKGFICNLCLGTREGFAYHCSSCQFDLDISCATHPQLVAGDFQKLQHFSHKHPLVFVQNIDFGNKNKVCFGCERGMSSPFYSCPDCTFYLHKKCAELPLKINHPSHRKHPLFCLVQSPPHQEKCSCYLCKKSYKGFVYYCSLCEFGFRAADASLQTITAKIHPEHPLIPFPTTNPLFICNACGIDGYRFSFPYICSECGLMLHEDCVCLSRSIKITRHHHQLSHIYFFQEEEAKERECNICHDEVNVEYGSYCCLKCNYFAHVNCAIDKDLLEEEEEGEVEKSKLSASDDSTGDLSCAFTEIKPEEIKHFAHKHNLIFSDRGVKDGRSCEGCMRPIATSFYYCEECDFFIHEGCAKLLKKVRHWASKHSMELLFHIIFRCTYCRFWNSGFGYRFDENSGFGYIFDEHCYPKTMCIRCHEILDTCTVERHEHPLFFDHKYSGSCCGCDVELMGGFRCKYKKCKFAIDYRCLVLPNTARYKYDNHLLTLTFHDNHHLSQCYCDICEEDRDPNHWFYHCADCDVSAHPDCLLRRSPYVKLGKPFRYAGHHQHPVTFVKIEFNPPKCNKCDKPCRDELAIQCTESNCNYIFHCFCLPDLYLLHVD